MDGTATRPLRSQYGHLTMRAPGEGPLYRALQLHVMAGGHRSDAVGARGIGEIRYRADVYYSLVGRGLQYEFQSFAEYHSICILVWSSLAGGFLAGKYSRANPAPAGTRFAEAGSFVPLTRIWVPRRGDAEAGGCPA